MNEPARDRIKLYEIMVLIAGLSLGLSILLPLRARDGAVSLEQMPLLMAFPLGGLSIVGVPLLILERWRSGPRRVVFGAGRLMWFAEGMAACLLWPPVLYLKIKQPERFQQSMNYSCFAYSAPLLALFLLPTFAVGGRFRRRRRAARSWRERFGFGLTLAWAAIGLYVLGVLYLADLRR